MSVESGLSQPITSRFDPRFEVTLYRSVGIEGAHTLASYRARGGYRAAEKALTTMTPTQVIDEVKASGLRGRGGAGFPAGVKWSFMPPSDGRQRFIVCNADESEPGSFKDRYLMEDDPHQLIEGMLIAGWAIQATLGVVYVRGEYYLAYERMREAIAEARAAGILGHGVLGTGAADEGAPEGKGSAPETPTPAAAELPSRGPACDFDLILHRGAGAYICGEETALMNSFEGLRATPRLKPPFPAQVGLYGLPSTINNVESLCAVVHIVERGAAWFAAMGTDDSKGTKLYQLSGAVVRPGVYEMPMGATFRELIYDLGGGPSEPGKAIFPGGSSTPVLPWNEEILDLPMDFGAMSRVGSMLGTGGVIVVPESKCMVDAMYNVVRFYAHESCGKCTPCREGIATWLPKMYQKLLAGLGTRADLTLMEDMVRNSRGTAFCPLADACAMPVAASFQHFRHEYEHLVDTGAPMFAPVSRWAE